MDNNEDMLEVRADILWSERQCSWLLKDYGDDVVPYVSLSQELGERRKMYQMCMSLIVTIKLSQILRTLILESNPCDLMVIPPPRGSSEQNIYKYINLLPSFVRWGEILCHL